MSHRERVITALNHQQSDRCPFQISFTPEFASRLRKELNFGAGATHNPHGGGNKYQLETALDEDMLLTSVGWANCYYQSSKPYTDEWGIGWHAAKYETPFGQGFYTEMTGHPLAQKDSILNYTPPKADNPKLYTDAENLLANYKNSHFIVGVTVTTIFETAWALRGLENLMMDFITDPQLANDILDIPYKYHLAAAKKLAKMGVDMIWTGDDIGGQNGMLISPKLWREFFKPRMANFIKEIKSINPELKVAYHSDGNISDVIEELIEIGVDVLNPIQPACIDPAKIKEQYGDRLCFWGSIDEQHTLPFGTAEDVKNEVIMRLKTIGKNGGLIIGPTHHVQLDTPMENFKAMIDTIKNTRYDCL